jgi:t-SNARE complex subunit (syntaxin)
MLYRIYYQIGRYGYPHGNDSRYMCSFFNDAEIHFLEAETIAELKKEMDKFTSEFAYITANTKDNERYLGTRGLKDLEKIMKSDEFEREIFKFITPIMEYHENHNVDNYSEVYEHILFRKFKEVYCEICDKMKKNILDVHVQKQAALEKKKEDPEYQKYLELQRKFTA